MISYLLSGAVTGLAVAMPIGAVGSYLVGLAARERAAIAVAAALGIASVDGAYAILAAVGGAGLQAMLSEVSGWLTYAAAITLVVVAVHTMRMALRRYRGDSGARTQLSTTDSRPRLPQPGRAHSHQSGHRGHVRCGRCRAIRGRRRVILAGCGSLRARCIRGICCLATAARRRR